MAGCVICGRVGHTAHLPGHCQPPAEASVQHPLASDLTAKRGPRAAGSPENVRACPHEVVRRSSIVTSRRRRLQPLSARRARVLSCKRPGAAEFVASGGTARRRHRAPCPQRAAETQHRAKQQQLSQPAPPREAARLLLLLTVIVISSTNVVGRSRQQGHPDHGLQMRGNFQFVWGWANLFASQWLSFL
eukprot:COSAG06_NODE_4670_length_4051_cov_1.799342_4_plen_189_part_00